MSSQQHNSERHQAAHSTPRRPRRLARFAAGVAVAAITVAGIGAATGGASASTGSGSRQAPVTATGGSSTQSTGWG